jgi:GNAT superfamily N-acetyltransferase
MSWESHPLTPERFEDFADVINPNRRTTHCWCLSHRLRAKDIEELGKGDREQSMRRLCERENPPGVVTYLDGAPVGWCNIGPRAEIPRLDRSKVIRPVDSVPVWSIVCVVVRGGHRKKGVTSHLIEGAVEYAASRGAPAAPAYPVETRWSDGHDNGFRRHPVDVHQGRLRGGRHDGRGRLEVAAPDCAPHPRRLTGQIYQSEAPHRNPVTGTLFTRRR